jgi:hypothetical protein
MKVEDLKKIMKIVERIERGDADLDAAGKCAWNVQAGATTIAHLRVPARNGYPEDIVIRRARAAITQVLHVRRVLALQELQGLGIEVSTLALGPEPHKRMVLVPEEMLGKMIRLINEIDSLRRKEDVTIRLDGTITELLVTSEQIYKETV